LKKSQCSLIPDLSSGNLLKSRNVTKNKNKNKSYANLSLVELRDDKHHLKDKRIRENSTKTQEQEQEKEKEQEQEQE